MDDCIHVNLTGSVFWEGAPGTRNRAVTTGLITGTGIGCQACTLAQMTRLDHPCKGKNHLAPNQFLSLTLFLIGWVRGPPSRPPPATLYSDLHHHHSSKLLGKHKVRTDRVKPKKK